MKNLYKEVEGYVKRYEVNTRSRKIEEDNDKVITNWNIGRLIVEAQGGEARAKYGNELIKEWSVKLTEKYGKGYDSTNLRKFRQFFIIFEKCATVSRKLTWSLIVELLPIKEQSKRNYYINMCITKNLSVRQLREEIKLNSYERLLNKPDKIEIMSPVRDSQITDKIKNPIVIQLNKGEVIKNEHDLEIKLLAKLQSFFNQLGGRVYFSRKPVSNYN